MNANGPIDPLSNRLRSEIINADSFEKKLKSSKKLRIKLGVDPTSPDLHLGHAVILWKLKDLQSQGHKIIFLIGDFTAKIGDPSGRNTARPILNDDEIEVNTRTYLDQVGKILDVDKCEIRKNSEWYKKMNFADVLKILGKSTVAQVLEREDFKLRLDEKSDIGIHEMIYPIMQGYDSVELKSDVEVGGQDQKLNMLIGRDMQRKYNQLEQDILIFPLLVGTDGKKKMSKSFGNYIGLNEKAENQFGKAMSIPDSAIEDYLELVCNFPPVEINELKSRLSEGENPKLIKEKIAQRIVELYHGREEAQKVRDDFDRVHRNKEVPEEVQEKLVEVADIGVVDALIESGLAVSRSEALRLISQGGVRVDGQKIETNSYIISLDSPVVLQVGKLKFVKLICENKR